MSFYLHNPSPSILYILYTYSLCLDTPFSFHKPIIRLTLPFVDFIRNSKIDNMELLLRKLLPIDFFFAKNY